MDVVRVSAFESIKVVVVEYSLGFSLPLCAYTINEQHGVDEDEEQEE